jgi:putative membrane protein (TIGR04086 family)
MQSADGKKGVIGGILKGCFASVIITLISILIFAGVVKMANLNSSVIKAVNQFIKVLSVFLACFFTVKGKGGLIKGGIVGCASAIIVYLIFSLMGGDLSFDGLFVLDLIFNLIVGAISGIIAVNVKKQ